MLQGMYFRNSISDTLHDAQEFPIFLDFDRQFWLHFTTVVHDKLYIFMKENWALLELPVH